MSGMKPEETKDSMAAREEYAQSQRGSQSSRMSQSADSSSIVTNAREQEFYKEMII